jgi:hypothetical protein
MNEKEAVKKYYKLVDKFKGGYFWGGFGNAQRRATFAAQNYLDFTGQLDGKELVIHFSINPSRNNLYKKQSITLGGKKVQRRTIERILSELP